MRCLQSYSAGLSVKVLINSTIYCIFNVLKFHSKTSLQDSVAPCSTLRLQSTFYTMPQYPCCFSKNGRMDFDGCLTQDDLSYIIESCILKTFIKHTKPSSFTQMRIKRSTKSISIDYILMIRSERVFCFKLGSEQRCHRLRSKKGIFVENCRFSAQA